MASIFGTSLPLIQAPMAGVQGSELALAVIRAGGLGSLPCATLSAETMQAEMALLHATGKPYNVNFFCHREVAFDAEAEERWLHLLAPYFREYEVEPPPPAKAAARKPFDHAAADVLEAVRPPVVSFHFGLPERQLMERVQATGAMILATATTGDEAQWLAERGVDAIIVQGREAGGHRGHFLREALGNPASTLNLLSECRQRVRVPLIAAGGIATAEGVADAINAGAEAVQVGTAFLLCDEAKTSAVHRSAIRSGAATAYTNLLTGRPARGILNRLMNDLEPMRDDLPPFPFASNALAPLKKAAESRGEGAFSPLWCGEDTSGCDEISAYDLTLRLAANL